MKSLKKWIALLLILTLLLSLSACTIPTPGFVDYDVSRYIRALLDSSYHDEHEDFIKITGASLENAQQNCTSTVQNAAVRFCNTYGLSPTDDQLQEIEVVMKHAFALTKYTVKDERKVDGGYYLEVEVASITNFEDRETDLDAMKDSAQETANETGESASELYVEQVLDFCKRELSNISYDVEARTVPLDIRQTDQGELQLDLNQLETIDETVIRF